MKPLALALAGRLLGATRPEPAEAIAVPGCALRPGGQPGRALAERLEAAAALHRAGLAPLVLVTGGRSWHGHVEADAMRSWLVEAGVPAEAVLVERGSMTTRDNARLGARVLRGRRLGSVLLVTQPLHLRRARRAFAAAGIRARGVLIEQSYQLGPGHLGAALRDLSREVAGTALDLLFFALRRTWP